MKMKRIQYILKLMKMNMIDLIKHQVDKTQVQLLVLIVLQVHYKQILISKHKTILIVNSKNF